MIKRVLLKEIVIHDSGVWGDQGSKDAGVPVLRSSNIQNDRIKFDDVAYRVLSRSELAKYRLEEGDIIITKSSGSKEHIGKCALFYKPNDSQEYYFSNFTLRLKAKYDKVEPKWIYYWLISSQGRALLTSLNNTTSGLRNLNITRYLEQELPLPSLKEQRRLTAILDKADTLRQMRKNSIKLLDELLRSVFLDMFGDPQYNPKNWPVEKLGDITEINPRSSNRNYGSNLLVSFIPMSYVSDESGNIVQQDEKTISAVNKGFTYFENGDVLFAKITPCMENGKAAIAENLKNGIGFGSTEFHVIRPSDKLISEFIFSYIRRDSFRNIAKSKFTGTAGQQRVPTAFLKELDIIVPPIKLQQKFKNVFQSIKSIKGRYVTAGQKDADLFNSLQQKAFKGEL